MARNSHSIGEPLIPYETQPEQPEESARREEYRHRLAEYLKDPQFRSIEGFPIGSDEDILALSDPHYYTACPNPFLSEIIKQWRAERLQIRYKLDLPEDDTHYHREPFAADVSEGKTDPIYNAHSYHTKVPHKAIMRYILHYTLPGDIVLDGFCGSGMAGIAAQLCSDKSTIESLGYKVKSDGQISDETNRPISRIGTRKVVLNDLSPAATFITFNYNLTEESHNFDRISNKILKELENEIGWMYETYHPNCDATNKITGKINYTVWSDVFTCPHCGKETVYWYAAVDLQEKVVKDDWICKGCGSLLTKGASKNSSAVKVERAWETRFDNQLGQTLRQAKQVPVLINYSVGNKRFEKKPDQNDLNIIARIEDSIINYPFPTERMPDGDESRRNDDVGITHVHHFYTKRNLWALSALWDRVKQQKKHQYMITAAMRYLSKLSKMGMNYFFNGGGGVVNAGLLGTLYLPSFSVENNVVKTFMVRSPKLSKVISSSPLDRNSFIISTGSSSQIPCQENVFDYIFIDPPFGGNIMYSELNFLWEAWFRVTTNVKGEAVVNRTHRKYLPEYQELMQKCFMEFYRLLKPGHWMTIEFHNSQNSVWNAIQEGLLQTGFVVADVRTLDKKQGTFKQFFS